MNAIRAGFAATCITPMPGMDIPGLFERRLARGTLDDLHARAAVFEGETTVALVQVDAIVVPETVVAKARQEAQRLCGIPAAQCFIAATHTHSGGPLFGGFLSEPDEGYMNFVAGQIAAAIAEAMRVRRPALVGWSAAAAPGVAFNRRFLMKDGLQRTHPGKMHPAIVEPAGPADPAVTVLSACDQDTFVPFGAIVHFACHATHINGDLYSADYVRWMVDTLRAVYGPGFGVVFLNGACGDVTQVDNRHPRPLEMGPYWAERTGRCVGGAALQAIARTDYVLDAPVACASTKVRAVLRAIPPETLRDAKTLLRKRAITAEDVETIYANESLKVDAMRRQCAYRTLEITGVGIGDGLFWGAPAEFFQAFALETAVASPYTHTCCVGLANGYNGYVCAESAFAGGGYEIRTARSSFLEENAGAKIVRAAQSLCRRMHEKAQPYLATMHATWPEYKDDSALDGINQLGGKSRN